MFSRGSRAKGRHTRGDRSPRGQSGQPDAAGVESSPAGEATPPSAPAPFAGPYDSADAPAGGRRLDLGSLKIPSVAGVEVRVQTNQEGAVQQVYLLHGDSMLQLGVFAAPRTESIWDEVRDDIRQALIKDGAATQEVAGEYGIELQARARTNQGFKDLRFVGVSGPRWLVRAVYQGPAAVGAAAAGPLAECLRGVVVERGAEARPAKEPLPLRLSEELAAQLQSRAASAGAAGAGVTSVGPPSQATNGSSAGRQPTPRQPRG